MEPPQGPCFFIIKQKKECQKMRVMRVENIAPFEINSRAIKYIINKISKLNGTTTISSTLFNSSVEWIANINIMGCTIIIRETLAMIMIDIDDHLYHFKLYGPFELEKAWEGFIKGLEQVVRDRTNLLHYELNILKEE
jgi:hypothetical protein